MCKNDDTLILYTLPPSPNSAVVRTFLLASEIPFEEQNVWGSTRSPEYIAKFPSNLAPAMEIGNFTVSESTTCIRYLAKSNAKAAQFYSTDPQMAAKIDMVLDMINTSFCTFISKAVYPDLGFPAYPGDVASLDDGKHKDLVAKSQKMASQHLQTYLNDKFIGIFLSKTKFLLTDDQPTLADFRLAPQFSQLKCAFPMPERIDQYLADMNKVPGFAEGMKPVDDLHSQFWKDQEC